MLKNKIVKLNSFSIVAIIIAYSILGFVIVFFILQQSLKRDIDFTKQEYLLSKKTIIKNEVYNFISFIDHTSAYEMKRVLFQIHDSANFLTDVLKKEKPGNFKYILSAFSKKHPDFIIALSDMKGNKIYASFKEYNKSKRIEFIKEMKKEVLKNRNYFTFKTKKGLIYISGKVFTDENDGKKYFITNAILKSSIEKRIKKTIINFVHTIKFVFNKGYISVVEILNYNGGKKFGRFVALPVNTHLEGLYIDDSKKDASGFEYRKKYLEILRNKGEGYFVYSFLNKNGKIYDKISFVKIYKPFNWAVFGGLYLDGINIVINKKKKQIKEELCKIFISYIVMSLFFLIVVYFIVRYENRIFSEIIDKYKKKIQEKNEKLKSLNKNLVKEVEKKTQELVKNFFTDPLTGLPNREKLLVDLKNHKYVSLLNIDSFKEINDFYGIETGDAVLKEVAGIFKRITNAYKLSADEYAFFGDDLNEFKSRIQKAISEVETNKFLINKEELQISIRAGIGESITKADMALKHAKNEKMAKIVVYNDSLPVAKEYENNIKWKNIIKEAIKEDKIIPHIQPLVNSQNFKVEKFECLIRIEHEGKIYSPFHFLEISKKTGQYLDLQKIMIEKCFKKFSKLNYKFSINLSAVELSNMQFKQFLIDKIDEYNIADKLIIELLEDEKMESDEMMGFLIFLHNIDVEFAIDDFGSGHSNLSYLITKLPVNILKIDGSLIKNINKNHNNYKLVKVLIQMAKNFNLTVVAEFVENEEIAFILKDLGVDYLQGYYFGKPSDINMFLG